MSSWNRRFQASSKLDEGRGVTLPYFPETFNSYVVSMETILEILRPVKKRRSSKWQR
jgi:hypothetical protein